MEEKDIEKAKLHTSKEWTQKKFGENLFTLMRAKGITQKELAKAVGVTAATLSSYKNGTKSPTLPVAAAIAKELGVSLDWLCDMDSLSEAKPANVTYSDVIQALVNLSNLTDVNIDTATLQVNGGYDVVEFIYFNDPVLEHFLEEWKQVKSLLDGGTITRNLYEPWVAQQLRDYDCALEDVPEKLQDEENENPLKMYTINKKGR